MCPPSLTKAASVILLKCLRRAKAAGPVRGSSAFEGNSFTAHAFRSRLSFRQTQERSSQQAANRQAGDDAGSVGGNIHEAGASPDEKLKQLECQSPRQDRTRWPSEGHRWRCRREKDNGRVCDDMRQAVGNAHRTWVTRTPAGHQARNRDHCQRQDSQPIAVSLEESADPSRNTSRDFAQWNQRRRIMPVLPQGLRLIAASQKPTTHGCLVDKIGAGTATGGRFSLAGFAVNSATSCLWISLITTTHSLVTHSHSSTR